jgi:DNA repair protein RadC
MNRIRWQMVREEGPTSFTVKGAADAATYLIGQGYSDRDREAFIVLLLNTKHDLIAEEIVSIGILDGSLIHPREVFKAAVCASAAAIILAHNHPSGNLQPSAQDEEVTRRLRSAGGILGIPVLDHIILGAGTESYYSFREKGESW